MPLDDTEKALLAQCGQIDSSTWSDALDHFDIAGVIDGLGQRSGAGRMCGFAATARQVPGQLHDFDKADFAVGRVVDSAAPGRVLVIDVGGEPISSMGGLAAFDTHRRGAAGVVIDGACRDVDEIRSIGLWMASRWVSPRTGKGRLRTQQLGETVTIAGLPVSQGDLIVGDDTGLVRVPRDRLAEVLARAQAVLALDHEVQQRMRGGESFSGAGTSTGYLPPKAA